MKKAVSILLTAVMLAGTMTAYAQTVNVDADLYIDAISSLEDKSSEIADLIAQCETKGITPDYEIMRGTVIERYMGYLKEELSDGVLYRSTENGYTQSDVKHIYDFNISSMNEIADEAITNLNEYLDGTKEAMQIPKVITSETEIDGRTITAMTELNGVTERNKVFLNGFGHYSAYEHFDFFKETGANFIQMQIGMSAYCTLANGITDWLTSYNKKPDATITLTEEEAHKGDKSLKITNATEKADQYYMMVSQPVKVEPETEYTLKFHAKGKNIHNFVYKTKNVFERISPTGQTSIDNWTVYSATFTTGKDQTVERVYLSTEGLTDTIYIDSVSLRKTGSNKNLISNPSFEDADPEDKLLDANLEILWEYEKIFREAEEKNIKIDLLLSPHYFVWALAEQYPDILEEGDTMGFRIGHEAARWACEFHAKTIAELADGYESINSICLANEPRTNLRHGGNDSYYYNDYIEYLKEKYGTIENYNKINGTNHNGFSKIQFPTSGLSSRLIMESYDYCNFADTVGKEWIKLMSMSVKAVSDKPVHVKQMEYVTAYDEGDARWLIAIGFDPQEYNRYLDLNGNDAELRIENDEVITTVSQYVEGKALAQSMWYDFQLSMKEAPVINSEDHILANGDKTYTKDHKKLTNVAQWMGAIHGRSMAATWIFDRTQTRPETYESIMYRPDLYENVSEINMDLNRLADEVYAVMESPYKVGILYSETARHFNRHYTNTMYRVYENCLYNGVKVGFVVESQLEKLDNYGLVIIPYATHVDDAVITALKEYKANGGRILLVGNNNLKYNNALGMHNVNDVAEICNGAKTVALGTNGTYYVNIDSDALFNAIAGEVEALSLNEVVLTDAQTGERIKNVEYTEAVLDGKRIISICNYDWDADKTVNVFINGVKMTKAKELRSGDTVGETLTLRSFEPILLEVNENDMTDSYSYICSDYTDVTIQIKESLLQTEGDLKAILAVYKDGILLGVDLETAAETIELYVPYSVKNTDGITANVMLWDMENISPVTEEIAIAGGN